MAASELLDNVESNAGVTILDGEGNEVGSYWIDET